MTLSGGKSPLSPDRAGRFSHEVPDELRYIEPYRRRVRGLLGGRTVVDSDRVLLLHRPTWPWFGYVFPEGDVDAAIAAKPEPLAPGHVQVRWDAVDEWFEEDERVIGHARNPYHRVDCMRTSRRLQVDVAGTTLTDTTATVAVFETGREPVLYVHRDDVRMDVLVPSEHRSYCSYKGAATYWDAVVGGELVEAVAWTYEEPLDSSGCGLIRGLLAFEETRVEVVHGFPPV